jgi:hypothetical protein
VHGEKKSGNNVPLFAPDKVTQIESLWQRTFLIPNASHHRVNHARHRGNGVRPTSCPFQVPSTRFWSKQTANFLKTSGDNPVYSPGFPPAPSGRVRKILGFLLTVKQPPGLESEVPVVSERRLRMEVWRSINVFGSIIASTVLSPARREFVYCPGIETYR